MPTPLTTSLLAGAAIVAAVPASDPLCVIENQSWRAELVAESGCCPNRLHLAVEDKAGGGRRRLEVASELRRSGVMKLVAGDKLLLAGLLPRGARALLLLDLPSGRVQDELWAIDYRLSPAGDRLVYSSHFPTDAPREERRSLLLLYDLTRGAAANRAGAPATPERANAGLPLYPEANATAGSYDRRLAPPQRFLSPFLWSADGRHLVFIEESGGAWWLVALELTAWGEPPRVARQRLEPSQLAATAGELSSGRLAVAALTWRDEATVELQLLVDGSLGAPLTLPLP